MTDIVQRLRHWSHGLTYDPAAGLMHEAAAEIERLRNGAADGRETVQSDRPSGVSDASAAAANQQPRERGCYGASPRSTNHDAVPEARVQQSTREPERSLLAQSEAVERGLPRTGNTPEPVAWYVRLAHLDTGVVDLCRTLAECRDKWSNRTTDHWRYVPLYSQPQPTLSETEREAIAQVLDEMSGKARSESWVPAILRNLLGRTR